LHFGFGHFPPPWPRPLFWPIFAALVDLVGAGDFVRELTRDFWSGAESKRAVDVSAAPPDIISIRPMLCQALPGHASPWCSLADGTVRRMINPEIWSACSAKHDHLGSSRRVLSTAAPGLPRCTRFRICEPGDFPEILLRDSLGFVISTAWPDAAVHRPEIHPPATTCCAEQVQHFFGGPRRGNGTEPYAATVAIGLRPRTSIKNSPQFLIRGGARKRLGR
jgi:hypothetical protein